MRGFSLVHAPYEPNLVAATRMRDTAFKRVLKNLPIGSELKLDAPYGDFTYIAIASDSAPDDWQGEHGRVDEAMVKKYVSDLSKPIYYLSGPEGMVKAMRKLLIDLKVNEDNMRTEEFTGY